MRSRLSLSPRERFAVASPAAEPILETPSLTTMLGLGPVSYQDRQAIDACLERARAVPPRQDIIRQGHNSPAMQIIVRGWAFRYKLTADGGRHIPYLLLPNNFCDLESGFGSQSRCGVTALTPCHVASISREAFRDLARRIPALAVRIAELALRENAILTDRTISLGRRAALERLSHFMCEMAVRLAPEKRAETLELDFPLTQEQLSDLLGLTSVHVNRMLRQLRVRQLITLQGGRLNILDWGALVSLAGFDPAYLSN